MTLPSMVRQQRADRAAGRAVLAGRAAGARAARLRADRAAGGDRGAARASAALPRRQHGPGHAAGGARPAAQPADARPPRLPPPRGPEQPEGAGGPACGAGPPRRAGGLGVRVLAGPRMRARKLCVLCLSNTKPPSHPRHMHQSRGGYADFVDENLDNKCGVMNAIIVHLSLRAAPPAN